MVSSRGQDAALDILINRDQQGWVITPLSDAVPIQLREATAGVPPSHQPGVIWRLDYKVLQSSMEAGSEDELPRDPGISRGVLKRLKRVGIGMESLQGVTEKLQAKLSRFQEDQLALDGAKKRLEENQSEVARVQTELKEKTALLEKESAQFQSEVRKAAQHMSQALRAPVRVGQGAALPADALFIAAQDEFANAAPALSSATAAELRHVRLSPEAAFLAAKEAFSGKQINPSERFSFAKSADAEMQQRVEAVVQALLALRCLDPKQAPSRFTSALEQLCSIAQSLAKLAYHEGRTPLAFAASTCCFWSGMHLVDSLTQRWEEVQPVDLAKDFDNQTEDQGALARRVRQILHLGSIALRLLKGMAEIPDHRRRSIRFFANKGVSSAAEADLRLLLLPRDTSPTELAAHLQRVWAFIDDVAVTSKRKRPRTSEADASK